MTDLVFEDILRFIEKALIKRFPILSKEELDIFFDELEERLRVRLYDRKR